MLLIHPSEEMSKLIRVELNEDVKTRDSDLKIIKEWLAKQPHLPNYDGKKTLNKIKYIFCFRSLFTLYAILFNFFLLYKDCKQTVLFSLTFYKTTFKRPLRFNFKHCLQTTAS